MTQMWNTMGAVNTLHGTYKDGKALYDGYQNIGQKIDLGGGKFKIGSPADLLGILASRYGSFGVSQSTSESHSSQSQQVGSGIEGLKKVMIDNLTTHLQGSVKAPIIRVKTGELSSDGMKSEAYQTQNSSSSSMNFNLGKVLANPTNPLSYAPSLSVGESSSESRQTKVEQTTVEGDDILIEVNEADLKDTLFTAYKVGQFLATGNVTTSKSADEIYERTSFNNVSASAGSIFGYTIPTIDIAMGDSGVKKLGVNPNNRKTFQGFEEVKIGGTYTETIPEDTYESWNENLDIQMSTAVGFANTVSEISKDLFKDNEKAKQELEKAAQEIEEALQQAEKDAEDGYDRNLEESIASGIKAQEKRESRKKGEKPGGKPGKSTYGDVLEPLSRALGAARAQELGKESDPFVREEQITKMEGELKGLYQYHRGKGCSDEQAYQNTLQDMQSKHASDWKLIACSSGLVAKGVMAMLTVAAKNPKKTLDAVKTVSKVHKVYKTLATGEQILIVKQEAPSQDQALNHVEGQKGGSGGLEPEKDPDNKRPHHRQSEKDVGKDLGSEYKPQVSYKDGEQVPYGTKGSTRPDYSNGETTAFEVKNYQIPKNQNKMVNDIVKQSTKRQDHLPRGMEQNIVIDVRGQTLTPQQKIFIEKSVTDKSGGIIKPGQVGFKVE